MHNDNMIDGALIKNTHVGAAATTTSCCKRNAGQVREMETSGDCENLQMMTAEELINLELLIETTRPLTSVVPQDDSKKEEDEVLLERLQAYAPM